MPIHPANWMILSSLALVGWLATPSPALAAAGEVDPLDRAIAEATVLARRDGAEAPRQRELPERSAEEGLEPAADEAWMHVGLLRIRDLTPFGIQRLDLMPAHALPAVPGTWALELNISYQNTFVLSDNVAEYLEQKGNGERVAVTPADAEAILGLGENAYLVDGEQGLFDLTAHYRWSEHWGSYVTIPVLTYQDGIFDEVIESFHDQFGFDTANRELARQDDYVAVARIGETTLARFDPPDDGVGDPVFGGRYSLFAKPRGWNLVAEAAVKVGFRDHDLFHSSGKTDYGVQLSLQKFFRGQALYLSLSEVYFAGYEATLLDPAPNLRKWIPTAVGGFEFKIHGRTNGIVQLYVSPSVVQDTQLEELSAAKYQLSGGVQAYRKGWIWRLAFTENLRNLENTPDIGATLSVARVVAGSRPARSASRGG